MKGRRAVMMGSLAGVFSIIPLVARAQVLPGCTIGYVNGLLQVSPDCLIDPPGSAPPVAPPGHLISLVAIEEPASDVQTAHELRAERLLQRRTRKDDRIDRRRRKKQEKRERRKD